MTFCTAGALHCKYCSGCSKCSSFVRGCVSIYSRKDGVALGQPSFYCKCCFPTNLSLQAPSCSNWTNRPPLRARGIESKEVSRSFCANKPRCAQFSWSSASSVSYSDLEFAKCHSCNPCKAFIFLDTSTFCILRRWQKQRVVRPTVCSLRKEHVLTKFSSYRET